MFAFASPSPLALRPLPLPTANDRLKAEFGPRVWTGVIAATVAHFLLFALFPDLSAADWSRASDAASLINLPPVVEIPPPPEALPRPQRPVPTTADIDDDILPYMPPFVDIDPTRLTPPPDRAAARDRGEPTFTPFDTPPALLNREEVARTLERAYPAMLREAGVGGETLMWFHIDTTGAVLSTRLIRSSGLDALDAAAAEIARTMRFRPARSMDRRIPVWVQLPIRFQPR